MSPSHAPLQETNLITRGALAPLRWLQAAKKCTSTLSSSLGKELSSGNFRGDDGDWESYAPTATVTS